MKPTLNFTCIRCGYLSTNKPDMRKHLYKKKTCPHLANDVELTNEVKEDILLNRVHRCKNRSATAAAGYSGHSASTATCANTASPLHTSF